MNRVKYVMKKYLELVSNHFPEYLEVPFDEEKTIKALIPPSRIFNFKQELEIFWAKEKDELLNELRESSALKQYYVFAYPPFTKRIVYRYYNKREYPITSYIKRSSLYSDNILLHDPLPKLINDVAIHGIKWFMEDNPDFRTAIEKAKEGDTEALDTIKVYEENRMGLDAEWTTRDVLRDYRDYLIGAFQMLKLTQEWIEEGIVILVPDDPPYRYKNERLYEIRIREENSVTFIPGDPPDYEEKEIEGYGNGRNCTRAMLKNAGALNALISTDSWSPYPNFWSNWDYLKERIEISGKILGKDFFSLAALNNINVKFLDNVPLDFALKIREEGYLSELRSFFREKFGEIQKTPDQSEFYELVNNYSIEVLDEVKKCEREWKDIKKTTFEKIGVKGNLALASGVIGGAVSFGLTIPAWIGALGGVLFSSNYTIKDIVDEILQLREKRRDLHRNAAYLLYELKTGGT